MERFFISKHAFVVVIRCFKLVRLVVAINLLLVVFARIRPKEKAFRGHGLVKVEKGELLVVRVVVVKVRRTFLECRRTKGLNYRTYASCWGV